MKKLILPLLILFSSQHLYAGSGSKYCSFIDGPNKGVSVYSYDDRILYDNCRTSNDRYYQNKYDKCTADKICLEERKRKENLFTVVMIILGISLLFCTILMIKEINDI